MYGTASSIIFDESGYGRSEVLSSAGSRQGLSWGSFLYCLTTHPLLLAAEAVRAAGMPTDVEIATDGTRVLGGPAGSVGYCRSFAESVVQEVIEDLDVISRMSSLQAQHCLTVGSVQHRVNHLWRMIPGGENSILSSAS